MKKIKLLGFIALSVFAFASCDFVNDVKDAIDDIQDDQEAQYTESENGLEITVSYKKSGIGIYHIANFKVEGNDTICTSLVTKTTYFTEELAAEAYRQAIKDMDEKDKARVKLEGKAVIVNHPENIGQKKAIIKLALMSAYQGYKKGADIVSNIDFSTDGGEGDGGEGDSGEGGQQGGLSGEASYVESRDGLSITVSYMEGDEGEVVDAVFYVSESESTDTLCSSLTYTIYYPSEDLAQTAYNNNTEDLSPDEIAEKEFRVDGNKFIFKEPGYEGMPKYQVVIILKGIYARLQEGIIM